MSEHALIVTVKPSPEFDLEAIDSELGQAVVPIDGEYDGWGASLDGSGIVEFFLYGPDADDLYRVVEPILRRAPIGPESFAVKRYGAPNEPGVREVKLVL